MILTSIFKKQAKALAESDTQKDEYIRQIGTPTRATGTDIINKRNGWVVIAIYEDRWIGTQSVYTSKVLKQKPEVYIGGEVMVYVDDTSCKGDYLIDC